MNSQANKQDKALAKWLKANPTMTREAQAAALGISRAGLQKAIARLVVAGLYVSGEKIGGVRKFRIPTT